jgi:hypothetical protein
VHTVGLPCHDHAIDPVCQHRQVDLMAARVVDGGSRMRRVVFLRVVR